MTAAHIAQCAAPFQAGAARLSNTDASLFDLAQRIRAEHAAVAAACSTAVQHALAAGRALIEAKELVGHGHWIKFLKDCDLGKRQAERYAQLARLYDANASPKTHLDLAGLSIEAAIKELSPPGSSGQTRKPRPSPTPATQQKLNSLAWANASPTERTRFVSAIGWQSLAAAMPPDWLPVIQDWLQAHLPNDVAAITIDQDGNVLPDDLSIPKFLQAATTAPDAKPSPMQKLKPPKTRAALEDCIETVRRRAGTGEHISQIEWAQVDRWRKRLRGLQEMET